MTPKPQRGLNYSDLSKIVMERARTAREAVEIVGDLINKYGYATYGGNSHLFADADEGWVLIEFAGGRGLWVAQRLGPNDIRVSRPGYIEESRRIIKSILTSEAHRI
jgi:dipeptidase